MTTPELQSPSHHVDPVPEKTSCADDSSSKEANQQSLDEEKKMVASPGAGEERRTPERQGKSLTAAAS